MSHRTEQLGSVLHRAIQSVLERGLSDPRLRGVITVTRVQVSPDLKTAIAHVTISPEDQESLTMHGLRAASRHIRRRAGELVALRRLPELEFRVDERYKREMRTQEAISRGVETLGDRDPDPASVEHEDPA